MESEEHRPARVIRSSAPVRICDNGGWTDTWFARHGHVFNIAVSPRVEVEVRTVGYHLRPRPERIVLHVENFGDRYAVDPTGPGEGRHPMLEAAVRRAAIPPDVALDIRLHSDVPPGASMGTSAAVTVALVGALDALTPGRLTPQEAAETAHSIEVDMLKRQSGVQDQLCSAHGGISFIDMYEYPRARVESLAVTERVWAELDARLFVVYLGRSHDSSAVHEMVIRELEDAGPDDPRLAALRQAAVDSRDAVLAGDLEALGRVMDANTALQARLHSELVGRDAQRVIERARSHGACGVKVNGAAGEGGSVTLLGSPRAGERHAMIHAVLAESSLFQPLPVRLSRQGLVVTETDA
jgi:D-glycero-alpha-D-manno-heptose-7-phosphate kinase